MPVFFLGLLLGAAPLWESPRVPAGEAAPTGLAGMKASDCGACHQTIYAEWQTSTHAHAWVDAQFQRELAKDPEVGWVCINCHTPSGDQQEEITVSTGSIRTPERTPNPNFDPVWQQEGISCATCHIKDGAVLGPYGDTNAPHPVTHAPELLESTLCLGCHQAAARIEDTLVCSFNTGVEAEELGETRSCQSCHMPEVERPLLPGGEPRAVRKHLWLGSGIPKTQEQTRMVHWEESPPPGLSFDVVGPDEAAPGSVVTATITVTALDVGHLVPSGDPERYFLIEASVRDAMSGWEGSEIASTLYRIGQTWRWWPVSEKLADNRMSPGETRELTLTYVQPPTGSSIWVNLTHYRISPENAAHHDLGGYPTSRSLGRKDIAVEVPGPAVDSEPAGG